MRDLCSSANKVNSLGKPTNRWLNLYVNKVLLGDGNDDSNVLLVADIGNITNPAIRYNVINTQWEYSNNGTEYNAFGTGSGGGENSTTSEDTQNIIREHQLCTGDIGQVVYFMLDQDTPTTKQSLIFSEFDNSNVLGNPFYFFKPVYTPKEIHARISSRDLENKTFVADEIAFTYNDNTEFVRYDPSIGNVLATAEEFFTTYNNNISQIRYQRINNVNIVFVVIMIPQ